MSTVGDTGVLVTDDRGAAAGRDSHVTDGETVFGAPREMYLVGLAQGSITYRADADGELRRRHPDLGRLGQRHLRRRRHPPPRRSAHHDVAQHRSRQRQPVGRPPQRGGRLLRPRHAGTQRPPAAPRGLALRRRRAGQRRHHDGDGQRRRDPAGPLRGQHPGTHGRPVRLVPPGWAAPASWPGRAREPGRPTGRPGCPPRGRRRARRAVGASAHWASASRSRPASAAPPSTPAPQRDGLACLRRGRGLGPRSHSSRRSALTGRVPTSDDDVVDARTWVRWLGGQATSKGAPAAT